MPTILPYTQNRELSWLRFNQRVLHEALDGGLPLMERLKFISIFSSNLDEFFMVRVGTLTHMAKMKSNAADTKSGMTAAEQLEAVYQAVRPLIAEQNAIYTAVCTQLEEAGVAVLRPESLMGEDLQFIKRYIAAQLLPQLSPLVVGGHNPFPLLTNKQPYLIARFKGKEQLLGVLTLPPGLPQVVLVPGQTLRFIPAEQLLLMAADACFEGHKITERALICVTRNADVSPQDEDNEPLDEDIESLDEAFRVHMQKLLRKRPTMGVVRVESDRPLSAEMQAELHRYLHIKPDMIYATTAPMRMGFIFSLSDKLPRAAKESLRLPAFVPKAVQGIRENRPMASQIRKKDLLLMLPFERFTPFLQLLEQAAQDPAVRRIQITIYRLADHSRLVECLCKAAHNGKEVQAFIELRARFDEQNNIDYSQSLEDAGVVVSYGIDEYKTHGKCCLITYYERGRTSYITQVGTGNYNEKTCELYTDLSLITANTEMGREAAVFFQNLSDAKLEGNYHFFVPAPLYMKEKILFYIECETKKGNQGRIFMKMNSLTDLEVIHALSAASCAGVSVTLNVRGICCLLPGIPGYTENIRVFSIVGRFLEHARIYIFGKDETEAMLISSADMMTRNTTRRVELAVLVRSPEIRAQINRWMNLCAADNIKARNLMPDGTWARVPPVEARIQAQESMTAAPKLSMRTGWKFWKKTKKVEK